MQEIAAAIVVAFAAAYLVRKVFGWPAPRRRTTFVPLRKVKKSDGCH